MKHILIGLTAALSFALPAGAATLLAYDIDTNGQFVTATEEATGVSGSVLARSGGLIPSGATTGEGLFRSKAWTNYGDAATARAGFDSLTWGFSSSVAYDLSTLEISYDGSNKGPSSITIDVIVNGGSPILNIFTDNAVDTAGETNSGIDLSAFTDVTSIQFILSGWNARASKGTFAIQNLGGAPAISVFGEEAGSGTLFATSSEVARVTPVPLPAGLPLLAVGLGALAVLRRRR